MRRNQAIVDKCRSAGNWKKTKTRLLMQAKLIPFLMLAFLFKVNAHTNAQKVTLNVKNAAIASVFNEISRQTGYSVFYNDAVLLKSKPVSLQVKNMPLEQALKLLLEPQSFVYYMDHQSIAIREKHANEKIVALNITDIVLESIKIITVKGTVLNGITNEPIEGATVYSKNAKISVITNEKGAFEFTTPGPVRNVEISYVGFQPYLFDVKENISDLVIRLQPKEAAMDEIVVTGIINKKRSTYTGAAVTYNNDDLRKVGNSNVFQMIKNLSPSLVLDNFAMGSNPNALPDLQLRGTSTFPDRVDAVEGLKGNYVKNPNQPLFILDGFEASTERIFDLDINRIQSVTILKDAVSKAAYGANGANGVIVIETFRSTSSKPLVTYNGNLDIELPDLTSYHLASSSQKLEAEVLDGFYKAFGFNIEDQLYLDRLYNSRRKLVEAGLNTDWLAKPLRDGIGQKHSLLLELAGNNLNFSADFSYKNTEGIMKGSNRQNIGANFYTQYRVKNFLFSSIVGYNSNKSNNSPYGEFNEYAKMNNYWKATNADGTIPFYAEEFPDGTKITNPLYNSTLNIKDIETYNNFNGNLSIEWSILPGLRAVGRIGVNTKNNDADLFLPAKHTSFDVVYMSDFEAQLRKGSYKNNTGKSSELSSRFNLAYSKQVDKHFYFASAGFDVSEEKYQEVIHRVEGFSSDRMEDIQFGAGYALGSRPTGASGLSRQYGVLANISYVYDERFLADASINRSADSKFGSKNNSGVFYSFGLGWNLHNESIFRDNLNYFNYLKLRGSVGSSGNSNIDKNYSIPTYEYDQLGIYNTLPGSFLVNLPNPDLKWETATDYNIGIEGEARRLSFRFDYYTKFTENTIGKLTLPNSTGFDVVYENLGKIKNNGIEAFASYKVYTKGRNFVSVFGSVETNNNKIISLSEAMKARNAIMNKIAENQGNSTPVLKYEDGLSLNAIWAVPSLGIDPATGREIYLKKDGTTTYTYNANDLIVGGNSLPKYEGTFGISAEMNGIGINISARYLGGGQLYNNTLLNRVENVDMMYNVDERVLTGRWTTPGQIADFKKLGVYSLDVDGDGIFTSERELTRATTRFIQDRNELTIGALNVYYLLNNQALDRLGIQRLKFAFNMNDLATISTIRIERGTSYPFARTLSFSVSATF